MKKGDQHPAKSGRKTAPPLDSYEQSLKLAFEMHNSGRALEAEALCRVLLQIRPDDGQLLFLLGMILHKAGMDDEAVRWLLLAGKNQPKSARIFHGLGCAYQGLEDHERAAAAFEIAIRLEPRTPDAWYQLGLSCYWQEDIERAVALFSRAVEINPRDSRSWNNLGKCLKELNRLDESIEAYNRALEIEPDYALMRYGRAVSLLCAGRLAEGFKEYEWRRHSMKARHFFKPEWHGENAPGRTLLLHAEQGFGDAIQMVRFIRSARRRVGRIVLECRPELRTLLEYSRCADIVVPYGASLPEFDLFLSLSSLPFVLGTTLETIPTKTPYLAAPVRETPLPAGSGVLKAGLAWAGNPGHHQDAARSVQFLDLAPILDVPGVAFYSLQKPVPGRDEPDLGLASNIHSNLDLKDFLATASIIAELDLVIAVDTAVAHLAGALGKPVWLLLQHSPDWRWFLNRSDTPWYPTMRLFRQTKRNSWKEPIARIAEELTNGRGFLLKRPPGGGVSLEQIPCAEPIPNFPNLNDAPPSNCGVNGR